jgi:hypothetical protein
MDNITAQLKDGIPGDAPKHNQRDNNRPQLLLHFRSHNDTISANSYSQTLQNLHAKISTNIRVKSMTASLCCMTQLIPMQPTECRISWIPCNRGAQTSCIQPKLIAMRFSPLWTIKQSPHRPYIHVELQCAGSCGAVVYTAAQRILCKWNFSETPE